MPEITEKTWPLPLRLNQKHPSAMHLCKKAEMVGYQQIRLLFRAVSEAESVHARRYLMLMRGKIGSTEENLETAFQNKIKANVEEYPRLIKTAAEEDNKAALNAFK